MNNNPNATPEAFAEALSFKIWRTKGARFNAYRRLEARHSWSTATLAILSSYLIIVSLGMATPVFGLSVAAQAKASFVITALSILLLALSLLEASKAFQLRAHSLHECGKQLVSLQDRLGLIKATALGEELGRATNEILSEYDTALARCPYNHEAIDDALVRYTNWRDFQINRSQAILGRLLIHLRISGFYVVLIVVPAALGVWWLFH